MERWLIHWPRNCEALPWPYGEGWRNVVQSDLPLVCPASEFGLVSMCDGSTERPHVPANLPRQEPRGDYRVGFYHDRQSIYVLFTGRDAPPVISQEEAERRAGPMATPPVTVELYLMAMDSPRYLRQSRLFNGQLTSGQQWAAHGPRVPPTPEASVDVAFCEAWSAGSYRCGWRLPRRQLGAFMNDECFRASLVWQSYVSLELAVWGSSAGWGIRPDEMNCVRLVSQPSVPFGPSCQRLLMAYDPAAETARFELDWTGLYKDGEAVGFPKETRRMVDSNLAAIKVNSQSRTAALAPTVETAAFPLIDGFNRVEVSTAGGEPLAVYVEKRSGHRLPRLPFTTSTVVSQPELEDRMQRELAHYLEQVEARRQGRAGLDLLDWPCYHAASCARYYRYRRQDPRCLEIVRDVAERTVALQRQDGTFSGYHLGRQYKADREAPAWAGGAYDSGQAGELWCVAAWVLEDDQYLDASRRLVAAYDTYRIEFNQNFAAFALYHLVTHYRLTGETEALDKALFYCRNLVATKILPLGYQSGHNYYTVYGFITLRGMSLLCQVLPLEHPYRPTLHELCLRMAHQLLIRLQPDGRFDSRDRIYVGERLWLVGLFSVALLLDASAAQQLDEALQLQLQQAPPLASMRNGLLDSEVIRYLHVRENLLAGRDVALSELI